MDKSTKRNKWLFYIYVLIWIIYGSQDFFFGGAGTRIAQVLLLILLLWSFVILYKVLTRRNLPASLKGLTILLSMYIIYGIIPILIADKVYTIGHDPVATHDYLKNALISLCPIYVFYDFARKGTINISDIKILSIIFLITAIISYYTREALRLADAVMLGSDQDEFTNNTGYLFLHLLPFAYFLPRKYSIPYVVIVLIYLVMALKRGAILLGAICVIIWIYSMLRTSKRSNKFLFLIAAIGISIYIGKFILNFYENSDYFQYRVEATIEGDTSGRDIITESLLQFYLNDATELQMLAGTGANGTLKYYGKYAHNDWLETLINQGIIGVIILFIFYLTLYRTLRKTRAISKLLYYSSITLFIGIFGSTLFSMSICNMRIYTTLLLGCFIFQSTNNISRRHKHIAIYN